MPVIAHIPHSKKKQIKTTLKKMGINVLETSFNDYLIILSDDIKKLKQIPIIATYSSSFVITSYSEATRLIHTPFKEEPIEKGDNIKITSGPFSGMNGIVKDTYDNKAVVIVNCLGVQTEIDVDIEDCVKQ